MTSPQPASAAASPAARTLEQDVHTTVRNAVKLALSLVATWSVALVIRLLLPRYLGPASFGVYTFADSMAAVAMGVLGLGVDSYIQKEIPVRPRHASEFLAGVIMARSLLALVTIFGIAAFLQLTGTFANAVGACVVLGLGYTLQNLNNTLAALLQANTTVGGLAIVNPIAKLAWGVLVGLGMALGLSVAPIAFAFVVSEALRALLLWRLVRRELDVSLRLDYRATLTVLTVSLPLFLNSLVLAVNARLDVAILGVLVHDEMALGWYGAALNLAGLTLMLTPLAFPVLMPLMSRALRRSPDEFWAVLRVTLQALVTLATPVALFIALGADVWVRLLFGAGYAASAASLRALAPQFVFTYLAMLGSISLVLLERSWVLTRTSLVGLAAQPILAVALIPLLTRQVGPAGAGVGAALAAGGMELLVAVMLFAQLGRRAFDREVVRTLSSTLLVCGLVTAAYVALQPIGLARLPVALALYAALALALGAVPLARLRAWVGTAMDARRAAR